MKIKFLTAVSFMIPANLSFTAEEIIDTVEVGISDADANQFIASAQAEEVIEATVTTKPGKGQGQGQGQGPKKADVTVE